MEVVDDLPGEFAERIVEAFHSRSTERFRLGLTSGDVAQRCYERLAAHAETQIDWWLVELWTNHSELARQALLNRVGAAYAVHGTFSGTDADTLPLDLVHLDLRVDGSLAGWPGDLSRPGLAIVTASGVAIATALAKLRAGSDMALGRLGARRGVVVLADHAAASAVPLAH
jgi:hypothetical protein